MSVVELGLCVHISIHWKS